MVFYAEGGLTMKSKATTYDARAVANELIGMAWANGKVLYMLQIIKLVYLCDAWMLGLYDRPLIKQDIEAWQYGPVIADLYHSLKLYRNFPIHDKIRKPHILGRGEYDESFDEDAQDIIRQVYEKHEFMTGVQLSALTHRKGSPWHQLSEPVSSGRRNVVIPREIIKAHYKGLLDESRKEGNT